MIDGHGNNLYDYEGKVLIDFSSNVAFNHSSERIVSHLRDHLGCVLNYPDPRARKLVGQIAQLHGVKEDRVLVTNGSEEAFYLIAYLFEKLACAICIPSFAEYEDACRLYAQRIKYLSWDQLGRVDLNRYHSVWIGNPNNPDGRMVSIDEIEALCRKYRTTHFIVDASYGYLLEGGKPITYKSSLHNLTTVYSLTEAFGVPGIRLGYVIGSTETIESLSEMRPPWSVNGVSQEAGSYIVNHYNELMPSVAELTEESRFLQKSLAEVCNVEVIDSSCNFFLSKLKSGKAADLSSYLLEHHGILIRDASNFEGLDDSYFRISAQNRAANEALIEAVKQWNNRS